MDGRINAQEGREQSAKCGQICFRPTKIMIPLLAAKVNNPPHLDDFAAHRDCSAAEAAPAARRVPPAAALATLRLPRGNKGYHWACGAYIQNASTRTLQIGR